MIAAQQVKSKRIGWNERLTQEQELDLDPYDKENDNLEGELEIIEVPESAEHPAIKLVLVGGQEADPGSIPKSVLGNVYCPTGEGGGKDPTCSPTSRDFKT